MEGLGSEGKGGEMEIAKRGKEVGKEGDKRKMRERRL